MSCAVGRSVLKPMYFGFVVEKMALAQAVSDYFASPV
jgi:hypothetical protein